ncbi:MAG: PHP domain-containing protein [Anaerovoracaceae bacterium]|jgi:putative hydrolase
MSDITAGYRMLYDLHTHTIYSRHHHGRGTIEENVRAAVQKGLQRIAITDHGPGHLFYGVRRQALPEMRAEIDRLQKRYPQIEILLGVEANICHDGRHLDLGEEERQYLDLVLAGYHYGIRHGDCLANWLWQHRIGRTTSREERLRERNTEMTIAALRENQIAVLTHPGDKGPLDIAAVAKVCAERQVLMEISTHHPHLTREEIEIAMREDVRFIISSDAHRPADVGTWKEGLERALQAGLDPQRIVNIAPCDEAGSGF